MNVATICEGAPPDLVAPDTFKPCIADGVPSAHPVRQPGPTILLKHMFIETLPQLTALMDVERLGGCIVAVLAWVPLDIDPTSLDRSDRFHQLIANISPPGSWEIPDVIWQIRIAYRLISQDARKELAAHCEAFFQAEHPINRF